MTLNQIISGVRKAQVANKTSGKQEWEAEMVNPQINYRASSAPKGKYFETADGNLAHFVDFDVAVTVDSSSDAGGRVGLKIAGFGIEGGGGSVNRDSVVSRVKFQVPIIFPTGNHQ